MNYTFMLLAIALAFITWGWAIISIIVDEVKKERKAKKIEKRIKIVAKGYVENFGMSEREAYESAEVYVLCTD